MVEIKHSSIALQSMIYILSFFLSVIKNKVKCSIYFSNSFLLCRSKRDVSVISLAKNDLEMLRELSFLKLGTGVEEFLRDKKVF